MPRSVPILAALTLLVLLASSDLVAVLIGIVAIGVENATASIPVDLDGLVALPTGAGVARNRSLLARARRAAGRAWMRLPHELQPARLRRRTRWAIGLYAGEDPLELSPMRGIRNPIVTRDSIRDVDAGFVADPFLYRFDDRWYLFYEVFDYDTGQGEIGVSSSADLRSWKYEGLALVEPHHLSYPLAFSVDGAPHLLVESSAIGVVRAYRATDFPRRWEPVADLLSDGPRQDPTLFEHDGSWFLFTGGRDDAHKWGRLDLHVADSPLGPFEPHPASPIVYNDPTRARPAGRIVRDGGRILRFAQDCMVEYGKQVHASVIERLTAREYVETPIGDGPILSGSGRGWTRRRMHHIDAHRLGDGSWVAAVDGW